MKLKDTRQLNPQRAAALHLQMLAAFAPSHGLFDVRYRVHSGGLARFFRPVHAADVARTIVQIGQRTDVYVGCAVRVRRRGRRGDIAPTALLWADCDGPDALAALLAFTPAASAIIASGGEDHAHAYWTLTRPLDVDELEDCKPAARRGARRRRKVHGRRTRPESPRDP